jgi:tetratricopeptide (TPR) repeat protein
VVLTGQGGVGKTALARRWARGVQQEFRHGQLYIDLNGFSESDPVDPGEALGFFLRALGVPPARVPPSLDEQAALYRSRTADRSLLIVLDNAFSAAQVRVLLPASDASFVVVTSRLRLAGLVTDGAAVIDVYPLAAGDSVALLEGVLGPERVLGPEGADRRPAESLAEICGGLPIALAVAAAQLTARPRLTVARLVADLELHTGRLRGLRTSEGVSVQGTLDLSYRSLDPRSAALYRRLAAHPGREFGLGPVTALLASAGDAVPAAMAMSAIDLLMQGNLVEETSMDRFRFHDLLLLHARQQLTAAESEQATRTLLEWYLAAASAADQVITPYRRRLPYSADPAPAGLPSFADREEALDWLDNERLNLIAAGHEALSRGWAELAWHLSDVMWPLMLYRKIYRDRIGIDETGVAAALLWGNEWAEADMRKRLGRAYTTAGRYEDAEQQLRLATERCDDVGDVRGAVDAREMMAALYRDSGRPSLAIAAFEDRLAANRELGDARWTGLTLISLGSLLSEEDRAADAVGLLREAREIFATLADVDPYNGVRADIALAAAHLAAGDLPSAEAAATRGLAGMRRLGSEFEQAQAIEVLGRIADRRGDADAALRHRTEALTIYSALQSPRAAALRAQMPGVPGTTDPLGVEGAGEQP